CSASVSTLAHVMSGCRLDAASKIGAKARHGPHHAAQKSMKTIPSFWIVVGQSSVVIAVVDMVILLGGWSPAPRERVRGPETCSLACERRWLMPAALVGVAAAAFIVGVAWSRFHHDVVRIFEARDRLRSGGVLLDVDLRGDFAQRHPRLAINIPLD